MENMNEKVAQVLVTIKEAVSEHLDSKSLVSEGLLDSLDIMKLIVELENTFDIEIDPEDVLSDNFESVDAIVALVNKCKN